MNSQWQTLLGELPASGRLEQHGVIPLTSYTLITVTGPDAIKFLNGQCTCDVNKLTNNQWQLGAHCNVKGKMVSSFVMAKLAENCIGLRVHSSIADITFNTLKKYIVFSKADIQISALVALSLVGNAQTDFSAELPEVGQFALLAGTTLLRHNANLSEIWIDTSSQELPSLLQNQLIIHANQWHTLMIEAGVADIQAATSDAYLPQVFNYDLIGGVNFKKGCYTGQEIIARLHYKGQSKQRIHGVKTTTNKATMLCVGQPVFASDGATLGEIVAIAATGETTQLLICSRTYNDNSVALFASPSGEYDQDTLISLTRFALPYAIP